MGVTPLTFSGTSTYASDFQSILNRAVGIASIPLQQLENQDITALNKKTQLGTLEDAVASLTTAVQSLGKVGSNQAISASSSNTAHATVTAAGATSSASYTINSITSLATVASETSLTGYSDSTSIPVSTDGTMTLVLGSQQYTVNLTSATNNLVGLQNAINGLNAGVTASILTTGNGNYLSLSANTLGATTLQLFDGTADTGTNTLTASNQGTDAVFTLNNLPVTRKQNTINDLIPGASLTLVAPTTDATTITLAPDTSKVSSALQTLVTAYNSVVDQVDSQTGKSAGLLSGNSVLLQLESTMRELTTYSGTGDVKSLADLGITLGSDGKMTFDSTVIGGFSNDQVTSAFQFFGSTNSGFGGLWNNLDTISNSYSGTIGIEQDSLSQTDARLQDQITTTTNSINSMQTTLLSQLSQADTLVTTLTSQQNLLTATIQSLNYVLYGKQNS